MSHTGGFRFEVISGEIERLDLTRTGQWEKDAEVVRYNSAIPELFRVGNVVFTIQALPASPEVLREGFR